MDYLQAIILGIIQGLTEFLPVSSSGHVEIGTVLFKVSTSENLLFITVIHGATALSTIVVYWKDIWAIIHDLLRFKYNDSVSFTLKILITSIPLLLLWIFYMDEIENFYGGRIELIGFMLIITSLLLILTHYVKNNNMEISYPKAFIIGIAQSIAVIPGISRSGATISTALILGIDKEKATRFSFLMVLIPIIGAMIIDVLHMAGEPDHTRGISMPILTAGFLASFISGILACRWMISIVKRGKLLYFAIYCFIVGLTAIGFSIFYAG